jgi:hypothetical protein
MKYNCKCCNNTSDFKPELAEWVFEFDYTGRAFNEEGFLIFCQKCNESKFYDSYYDFEGIETFNLLKKEYDEYQKTQTIGYKIKNYITETFTLFHF